MRILIALSLVLLMSACSTLSESECRTGDWYSIGLRDGQNGYESRAADHAESCRKQKVKPDLNLYNSGRSEGLRSYCTASNGYQVGLRGTPVANVCPAATQAAFQSAYQRGFERYTVQCNLEQTELRISQYAIQRDKLQEKIKAAGNDKDRRRLQRELENLNQQNKDDRRMRDVLRVQAIAAPLLYPQ
ncbi:DUF2799 domain-containing protein [Deefgea tanakiae]|uniref:DUF2799 domain-containing protein n=1 Tax=Deefgea tanakiae TaxID=2865840 RepID=A0ABX8Z4S5_9NEIS|nr:DUF2799 domain-containing protein [Deefgea tanakiae]QZA77592.1 DUF2799 domain-containing protein [Deefgea tanakiae]